MRLQRDDYSCGACAVLNALEALDIQVSLEQVKRLADTTPDGTDEIGIKDALDALGLDSSVVEWSSASTPGARGDWFFAMLLRAANAGSPSIVYSRPRQHWFAVIGALAHRLVVFDSDNTKENMAASGVHVFGPAELLQATGPEPYALRVEPPMAGRLVA